jgi:hypothetical protein
MLAAMTTTPPDTLANPAAFPPPAVSGDGILDFSPPAKDTKPKRFRIGPADDDIFTAAAAIPVLIAADFANGMRQLAEATNEAEQVHRVLDLFRQVLWPEDVERFIARCGDIRRPLDGRLLDRIMRGLMEEWGLRPQQPSEDSSDGPPDQEPGISSTEPPPPPALTSVPSPSTGSSTSSTPASPTPPTG